MYFFLSDCGRVLDCAHDDECSFKLTSAEARRSADDVAALAHARRVGKRNSKNKTRREYRRRHRYARPSVRPSVRFVYYFAGQDKRHIWTLRDATDRLTRTLSSTTRSCRNVGFLLPVGFSGHQGGRWAAAAPVDRDEGATTKTIYFSILLNSEFNRYDYMSMYWQLY